MLTDTPQKPTTDPVTVAVTDRAALHRLEMAAARGIIRELQSELATWAPLALQYEAEMQSRREGGFAVDAPEAWVRDLVRARQGRTLEDPGQIADWMER